MSVKVADLPTLRDQIVRQATTPTAPMRGSASPAQRVRLDRIANHLATGQIFYATRDMTALSVHAGTKLKATDWHTEARPSPTGLMFFDGRVGQMQIAGSDTMLPIDAVSWGPGPNGICHIESYVLGERFQQVGRRAPIDGLPRLVPMAESHMAAREKVEGFPVYGEGMLRALNAAWKLMRQPTVVEPRVVQATGRKGARRQAPIMAVTQLTLRRAYTPQRDPDERSQETTDGRTYSHRWVVSGHWRDQAKGPRWSQRETIWIADHEAGPEGAPLIVKEKVNVFRR